MLNSPHAYNQNKAFTKHIIDDNGVSERRNRTLLDMVRSMMYLTDLPLSFWDYALETSAFTLNRALLRLELALVFPEEERVMQQV